MPDYKEMYLAMFRANEKAVNLLLAATFFPGERGSFSTPRPACVILILSIGNYILYYVGVMAFYIVLDGYALYASIERLCRRHAVWGRNILHRFVCLGGQSAGGNHLPPSSPRRQIR